MKRRNVLKILSGLALLPAAAFTKDKQHPPVVVPPRIIQKPTPPRRGPDRPVAQMLDELRNGIRNYSLQFNDEVTRNDVSFNVNKYCREVGVHQWRVVCDETNNTPFLINKNYLIVDLTMMLTPDDAPRRYMFALRPSGEVTIDALRSSPWMDHA